MELDAGLDAALAAAAAAALPPLGQAGLLAGIHSVSERYTTARERLLLGAPDTPAERAARALFFLPADLCKVHVPLAELAAAGALPTASPLSILDLGCGLGTQSIGALAYLRGAAHITLRDRDPAALALAAILTRAAADHLGLRCNIDTRTVDLSAPSIQGRYDLILLGTTLNELHLDRRDPIAARGALLCTLGGRLSDQGALIVIEPALRDTARALEELREHVDLTIFAPCTHARRCPALAEARDFCHEDRPFRAPPRLARLIQASGLREHGLKFSYLTLRRAPGRRSDGARVVSAPLCSKGKTEWFVCSAEGRVRLRVLDRDRDPLARTLDRGDNLENGRRNPRAPVDS